MLVIITDNGYAFLFATSGNNNYVTTGNGHALLSFAAGDNSYTLPPDVTDDNELVTYMITWRSHN